MLQDNCILLYALVGFATKSNGETHVTVHFKIYQPVVTGTGIILIISQDSQFAVSISITNYQFSIIPLFAFSHY